MPTSNSPERKIRNRIREGRRLLVLSLVAASAAVVVPTLVGWALRPYGEEHYYGEWVSETGDVWEFRPDGLLVIRGDRIASQDLRWRIRDDILYLNGLGHDPEDGLKWRVGHVSSSRIVFGDGPSIRASLTRRVYGS